MAGAVIRSRLRDWSERIPGGPVPLAVWLAAVLAVVLMLASGATRSEYAGLAQTVDYEVSASEPGRVSEVTVELYDAVDAGDVVATLDAAAVTAALESAAAELRALEAELTH